MYLALIYNITTELIKHHNLVYLDKYVALVLRLGFGFSIDK